MAAIPTELIIEILLRLPVKSLISFKLVCKFWNDSIKSPDFIKLHLNRTLISNSDRHLLRWSEDSTLYSAKIDDLDLNPNDLYFSKLNLPFETPKLLSVVGSCNGVVCITVSSKNDVFLYNPLTNSHRKLPANHIPNPKRYKSAIYGFGYDSKNDDYKVLKICPEFVSSATVYSLKNNTWRSVQGKQIQIPCTFDSDNGVLVNEALHYTVCIRKSYIDRNSDSYRIYIYSFDLGTETFSIMDPHIPNYEFRSKYIPINRRYSDILVRCDLFLRELGGCVCIVVDYNYVPEVWVMKEYGNKESWTKLFSFINPWGIVLMRRGFFEPIVYSKDKDGRRGVLMKISSSELAWYDLDTEKPTKLTCHYDQPKYVLDKLTFHDDHPKSVHYYVGSLVSLN